MPDNTTEDATESDNPEPLSPRLARQKLAIARDQLAFLEFARRARVRLGEDTQGLDVQLQEARVLVVKLGALADARIDGRKKLPRATRSAIHPRREYLLFLDECGTHDPSSVRDRFPVFCLCGVIVQANHYSAFDKAWKAWKRRWLGSSSVCVHEPDVRTRSFRFFDADPIKGQARIDALDRRLSSLPFTCIAAAFDKRAFAEAYGSDPVDGYLPKSAYLMNLTFVLERFTHFLWLVGDDAQGTVIAESRGLREDAAVNHEYIRLHLEGTQFCHESQFRGSLRPSIRFEAKSSNSSGLQVADLMARPIAEKVLSPDSTPNRWDIVADRFYDGGKARPGSYGLKVLPSSAHGLFGEEFDGPVIKEDGNAEAFPSAD